MGVKQAESRSKTTWAGVLYCEGTKAARASNDNVHVDLQVQPLVC